MYKVRVEIYIQNDLKHAIWEAGAKNIFLMLETPLILEKKREWVPLFCRKEDLPINCSWTWPIHIHSDIAFFFTYDFPAGVNFRGFQID